MTKLKDFSKFFFNVTGNNLLDCLDASDEGKIK